MTEPLIVDTDQLGNASKTMGLSAGAIPAPLPKLSVSGSDSMSAMVAKGSVQVEAPMAALPQIKADATTVAQNIGVAGQKYSAVDQAYADKAKQIEQQFGADGGKPGGSPKPPDIHAGPGLRETKQGFLDGWFSKKDSAWALADTAIGAKADIPGYMVEKVMKGVPEGAPGSWAKAAFSDVKGLKGVSKVGGVLAAPFVVWHIADDMKDDGNSIWQATAREGGGFLAGAWAGATAGTLIGGPVGTVAGLLIGGAVGMGASKLIDKAWEPVANFVGRIWNGS